MHLPLPRHGACAVERGALARVDTRCRGASLGTGRGGPYAAALPVPNRRGGLDRVDAQLTGTVGTIRAHSGNTFCRQRDERDAPFVSGQPPAHRERLGEGLAAGNAPGQGGTRPARGGRARPGGNAPGQGGTRPARGEHARPGGNTPGQGGTRPARGEHARPGGNAPGQGGTRPARGEHARPGENTPGWRKRWFCSSYDPPPNIPMTGY
eukprot:gene9766-biopygen6222